MDIKLKVTMVERDLGGDELFAKIKDAARWAVNTGFFSDSPTHPESGLPMASHALAMEHGSMLQNRPERPFMRVSADKNLDAVRRASERYAKFLVTMGTRSAAKDRMLLLGDHMAAIMREQLMSGDGMAELQPETVEKKAKAGNPHPGTPLLASMAMHDAISSKVVRN